MHVLMWLVRKLRVTSQDKQASMHVPRFGTQSKQSNLP